MITKTGVQTRPNVNSAEVWGWTKSQWGPKPNLTSAGSTPALFQYHKPCNRFCLLTLSKLSSLLWQKSLAGHSVLAVDILYKCLISFVLLHFLLPDKPPELLTFSRRWKVNLIGQFRNLPWPGPRRTARQSTEVLLLWPQRGSSEDTVIFTLFHAQSTLGCIRMWSHCKSWVPHFYQGGHMFTCHLRDFLADY